jgi:hypothetical protein
MTLIETINSHLSQRIQKGELQNSELISILDTVGSYLNLMTFSDYAKREKISYNGVLNRVESGKVQVLELFNVKFVIDNK